MKSTNCQTRKGKVTFELAEQSFRFPVPIPKLILCHRASTKSEQAVRKWLTDTYDFVVSLAKVKLLVPATVTVYGDSLEDQQQGPDLEAGEYEVVLHYNGEYASKGFLDVCYIRLAGSNEKGK